MLSVHQQLGIFLEEGNLFIFILTQKFLLYFKLFLHNMLINWNLALHSEPWKNVKRARSGRPETWPAWVLVFVFYKMRMGERLVLEMAAASLSNSETRSGLGIISDYPCKR